MGDFKARLYNARSKLLRRGSTHSVLSSAGSDGGETRKPPSTKLPKTNSLTKLPEVKAVADAEEDDDDDHALSKSALPTRPNSGRTEGSSNLSNLSNISSAASHDRHSNASPQFPAAVVRTARPEVTLEQPTPIPLPVHTELALDHSVPSLPDSAYAPDNDEPSALPSTHSSTKPSHPGLPRRQSLLTTSNARIITQLLEPDITAAAVVGIAPPTTPDYFSGQPTFNASMLHRKIWVKRPAASATLVQIGEDDLVDDVRDMILKKYANSLGRTFDAPDVTLRVVPRDSTSKAGERTLGPEEEMCRTLDAYYPGGQTVNEALVIDVPQRRTPKPSPRAPLCYSHHDESRPIENGSEYFPHMPIVNPSPSAITGNSHESRQPPSHPTHSISVIQTGQLPSLPSPGGTTRRLHSGRPKYPRHNTSSPTTLTGPPVSAIAARPLNRPRHDSTASSDAKHAPTSNAPPPTPPVPADDITRQKSTPPTPRVASPRPHRKRMKPRAVEAPSLPAGMLDGSVPPINVLIVEDNIINLRVLGAFMQRLKVRWQRAMNGKEAVTKWRAGGFHLVLMDIQLPIMNGLEATKEIRRLERVNSIGVFSSGSSESPRIKPGEEGHEREINEDDRLGEKNLFKSPVIIVALTASSLQSDRHEALAAGCNDFLTKVSRDRIFPHNTLYSHVF
jgi:osomolarity two-component system response regulator SSK1